MMFEEREVLEETADRWWVFLPTGIAWPVFALLVFQWNYTTVYAISFLFAFWVAGSFGQKAILLVIYVGIIALSRGISELFIGFKLNGLRRRVPAPEPAQTHHRPDRLAPSPGSLHIPVHDSRDAGGQNSEPGCWALTAAEPPEGEARKKFEFPTAFTVLAAVLLLVSRTSLPPAPLGL